MKLEYFLTCSEECNKQNMVLIAFKTRPHCHAKELGYFTDYDRKWPKVDFKLFYAILK